MSAIIPPSGSPPGWGAAPWGSSGWGGPVSTTFQLLSAIAIAENVIQLVFNDAVYFTGLLDAADASLIGHYEVDAITTSIGYDGNPARSVAPAQIVVAVADAPPGIQAGAALDVILDRPMSPYPAQYNITINAIFNQLLSQEIASAVTSFPGLYRELVPPTTEMPSPARDFANPSSLSSTVGLASAQNPKILGVFSYDSSGDYSTDSGLASYKKRCFRRMMSRPGGFLHLGLGYGVGVPQQCKKLGRGSTVQSLATQIQKQISQEPETQACNVTGTQDSTNPGLARFTTLSKIKGGGATKFTSDFTTQ